MATSVELIVADNAEKRRYEAHQSSEVVGFMSYRLDPGRMTLIHTEIAPALGGRPNGPLFVRGRLKIVDADGRLIREDTRLALCRCGASENKPFCDGSHRRIGFTTAIEAWSGRSTIFAA